MDNSQFAIVLILYLCIDQGDGRWKRKDRATLQHDIDTYKKMAEKIEREIENFYDEYPERYTGDNIDKIHHQYVTDIHGRKTQLRKREHHDRIEEDFLFGTQNKPLKNEHIETTNIVKDTVTLEPINNKINAITNLTSTYTAWPKFEDVLLAIGKKYDWKNDRWIKVKNKIKSAINNIETMPTRLDNIREFHKKHKFTYKIVRLNKSKSRRSVVVAVSAVKTGPGVAPAIDCYENTNFCETTEDCRQIVPEQKHQVWLIPEMYSKPTISEVD